MDGDNSDMSSDDDYTGNEIMQREMFTEELICEDDPDLPIVTYEEEVECSDEVEEPVTSKKKSGVVKCLYLQSVIRKVLNLIWYVPENLFERMAEKPICTH